MFALRRLPSVAPRSSIVQAIRGNAGLTTGATSASESAQPPSASTSTTTGRTTLGRRRKLTADKERKWNRALPKHVVPAYDLALSVLEEDSKTLKKELKEHRTRIEEKEAEYTALEGKLAGAVGEARGAIEEEMRAVNEELERMVEKANIIEVQSEINLPQVRWAVNNAMADMSKLSHRYLLEQKWRKDGDLDLLMERIYQMNVVPDVLPVLQPTVDLHVVTKTRPTEYLKFGKVQTNVVPGVFLRPKQTLTPPKLYATVFHTDVRLYTMLLVDPDVPNPETGSYTTFLHWMKPNIPLSATSPPSIPHLNDHTTYIPPHPQRGSPYHRYVCLLLQQPPLVESGYALAASARAGTEKSTSVSLDIPVVRKDERLGFDVREFAARWNLDGAQGGGAHMWREIWDEDVSMIYKDILNENEPHYGQPPKADPYAQIKQEKKYHL
ncbi:hypothetical protein CVT25_014949 [Psilocybe cyanescens]|uniref:PEBP-like protein n=1 Tax=Psilocybe cyanescens TaxID=93625 RepID=A0A409XI78_PSICY|nr:hypothetical protein CVT25_014949 [Psilocybe cyanescens]